MAEGRFVLIYHEDMIENHAAIWDDDRALATWLRLLALADKLWPSPVDLPRGAHQQAVAKLTRAGLLKECGPHRVRIPSLDAKRNAQSNAGRTAARSRYRTANELPTKTQTNYSDTYTDKEGSLKRTSKGQLTPISEILAAAAERR